MCSVEVGQKAAKTLRRLTHKGINTRSEIRYRRVLESLVRPSSLGPALSKQPIVLCTMVTVPRHVGRMERADRDE